MDITQLMDMASTNLFPMVVAFYSLTRLESTIKKNTEVMIKISEKMGVDSFGN